MTFDLNSILDTPRAPAEPAPETPPAAEEAAPASAPAAVVEKPTEVVDVSSIIGPAGGGQFDFKTPDSIQWDGYPRVIYNLKLHILNLRQALRTTEREVELNVLSLKAKDWKGMGTNNDERDARLKLILADDADHQKLEERVQALDFAIKRHDLEAEKLEGEFKAKRLRYRAAVVNAELFGGIPIDNTRDDE